MFSKFLSDEPIPQTSKRLLALCALFGAAAIALFGRFEGSYLFFFTKEMRITPGLLSGFLGIGLLVPLYLRGILKFQFSIYNLVSAFVMFFIFSSLIQIVIGDGLFTTIKVALVIGAIVLAWVGMRGVANFAWFLLFIGVILNVQNLSEAMGIWGWLFVALSFFGLLLHTGLGPKALIEGLKEEYFDRENSVKLNAPDVLEDTQRSNKYDDRPESKREESQHHS